MSNLVGNPEDRFSHNEARGERGGLVVNASDSGSRGRRFESHSGQTMLYPSARRIYSPKVLVIPRKRWLRLNMTEKLFTGTLRINQPTITTRLKCSLCMLVSKSNVTAASCKNSAAFFYMEIFVGWSAASCKKM